MTSSTDYLKLLISRSILSGPLDFEIKRVACIKKSRAVTLSRSLQCRAFSRAVMDEKLLSLLFPVGAGAVVINYWYITQPCKRRYLY